MADLDSILSMVENPTRRRILSAIVREPHYPLQLSKELGISQQAVVKNLEVMERNGLVVSYRESSNMGPERVFYRPNSEFSITIDMRDGMFATRFVKPDVAPEVQEKEKDAEEIEDLRKMISEIDAALEECERTRCELVRRRNELIKGFCNCASTMDMDYVHRNLLYEILNRPDMGIKEMSKGLGVNEDLLNEMISEILELFDN